MLLLANGGKSVSAITSSARTRPKARSNGTSLADSRVKFGSNRSSASSTVYIQNPLLFPIARVDKLANLCYSTRYYTSLKFLQIVNHFGRKIVMTSDPQPDALSLEQRTEQLNAIAAQIKVCQKCGLSKERTHAVPGDGPYTADIMFIGEGPGFNEDKQGLPFVGQSG